eukprot:TRINITY_DN5550_c0_g1_i1.p1 TRINITY_DN5550_c0_g1~~TRINITY_DN5550_c0_g1_i1.p1  ORF type:complete len:281 (+),score=63.40 TRINITY_DN5550_c0_g1_i1:575-1417(+)
MAHRFQVELIDDLMTLLLFFFRSFLFSPVSCLKSHLSSTLSLLSTFRVSNLNNNKERMGNCGGKEKAPPATEPSPAIRKGSVVLRGYQIGEDAQEGDSYLFVLGDEGEFKVVRGVSSVIDGKKVIVAEEPEVVVVNYTTLEDGDGLLKGSTWEGEVQFIKTANDERILDLVKNDRRVIQYRCDLNIPMAVGYPQPFPSADSRITTPERAMTRPYYSSGSPKFLDGSSKSTFQQGIFNIMDQVAEAATVRSYGDKTTGITVLREMDMAILCGFFVARTWLN